MSLYLSRPGDRARATARAVRKRYEGHLAGVLRLRSRRGSGIPNILAKLGPNATEGNPPPFLKSETTEGEEFHAVPDRTKHVLAHVFKIVMDPYVGKVAFFRVHQGTITKDSQLYIGDGKRPFKVGHLYSVQGKDYIG